MLAAIKLDRGLSLGRYAVGTAAGLEPAAPCPVSLKLCFLNAAAWVLLLRRAGRQERACRL